MDWLRAQLSTRLGRYRCMSYVAGTALLVLVVIGIPLQFAANSPGLATWVGYVHGWVIFPVYVITIVQLAFSVSIRGRRLALMVLGGLIPGLAFVMERRVRRELAGVAQPVLSERPAG